MKSSSIASFILGLTLAQGLFFSQTHAQSRPSWAQSFRGQLNFELRDDRRFNQLSVEARNAQRKMQVTQQAAQKKNQELEAAQKDLEKKRAEVAQVTQAIAKAVIEKDKLNTKKEAISNKLNDLKNALELANSALEKIQENRQELEQKKKRQEESILKKEQECENSSGQQCSAQLAKLQKNLAQTKKQIKKTEDLLASAKKDQALKEKNLSQARSDIQGIQKRIANIEKENRARSQQLTQKREQVEKQFSIVKKIRNQLAPLEQNYARAKKKYQEFQNRFQAYRTDLINTILSANQNGFRRGQNAGAHDGQELAASRGQEFGYRDGQDDGHSTGTRDGRQSAYDDGQLTGEDEGQTQAQADGQRDGQREGTLQGHREKASEEASAAGKLRAQQSDAKEVGTKQGQEAGMLQAKEVGQKEGSKIGEAQAIKKEESKKLVKKRVKGAFAGAFSQNVPSFPAGYRGPRAGSSRNNHRREVVSKAFQAGHYFGYRAQLRLSYEDVVDDYYYETYQSTYQNAYNQALSQDFSPYYDQGREDGYQSSYEHFYPEYRDQFYQQARKAAYDSPDRNSSEFKQTYAQVEEQTYQSIYEQIRSTSFETAKKQTFAQNIEEQTQIHKEKRKLEVQKIYQENAVLKYVSKEVFDTGLNGVASQDGVFQPGESITYNLTIINFGSKAADAIKIKMANGKEIKLPSLEGRSELKIIGAAQSVIPKTADLASTHSDSLRVYSPFTSEENIQGRHYYSKENQLLNSGAASYFKLSYPLALDGLMASQQLMIDRPSKLKIIVKNQSKREYKGELKIELSSQDFITKTFSGLSFLKDKAELDDAEILVQGEENAYAPLSLSAKVTKNGVVLGKTKVAYSTMAKIPYSDKGENVIIVNSEASTHDLLDIIADFQGTKNVGIFDTSVDRPNRAILNQGLQNKTLLVLENRALNAQVERLFARSTNISLLMVDDRLQGLRSLAKTDLFKDSLELQLKLTGLGDLNFLFSAPMQNKMTKTSLAAVQTDLKNYSKLLKVAEYLRTPNQNYISKVQKNINAQNFFAPTLTQTHLLEVMNLHILKEVGLVTKAYLASGGGLFGSGRDKDIAELVKDDKNMLHNRLIKASDTKVKANNAGLVLAGLDSYRVTSHAFEDHSTLSDKLTTTAVNNRLYGAFFKKGAYDDYEKDVTKALKKYDRSLLGRFESTSSARFAPFTQER